MSVSATKRTLARNWIIPKWTSVGVTGICDRLFRIERMEREIWFEKFLWSYMPCHWKGVAAMISVVVPTVAAIILAPHAVYAIGYENGEWLQILIFFSGWITMLIICKRHS